MEKPPNDHDDDERYMESLPQQDQDIESFIAKLLSWIKTSPEKILALVHQLSDQLLELLPQDLRRHILALRNPEKTTELEAAQKKEKEIRKNKTKARSNELKLVANLQEAQNRDLEMTRDQAQAETLTKEQTVGKARDAQMTQQTQQQSQQQSQSQQPSRQTQQDQSQRQDAVKNQPNEKPVEKPQEKNQKPNERPQEKQDKEKSSDKMQKQGDKKTPKRPRGPKGGKPKGGKPRAGMEAEQAMLMLEEERRLLEMQEKIGRQENAVKSAGKEIAGIASQFGVNVDPKNLSNDKMVAPSSAPDAKPAGGPGKGGRSV